MGNWLSDPEHLAGSDPLVSLLSEGLLHRNWLRRKTVGLGGFKGSFKKRHKICPIMMKDSIPSACLSAHLSACLPAYVSVCLCAASFHVNHNFVHKRHLVDGCSHFHSRYIMIFFWPVLTTSWRLFLKCNQFHNVCQLPRSLPLWEGSLLFIMISSITSCVPRVVAVSDIWFCHWEIRRQLLNSAPFTDLLRVKGPLIWSSSSSLPTADWNYAFWSI